MCSGTGNAVSKQDSFDLVDLPVCGQQADRTQVHEQVNQMYYHECHDGKKWVLQFKKR